MFLRGQIGLLCERSFSDHMWRSDSVFTRFFIGYFLLSRAVDGAWSTAAGARAGGVAAQLQHRNNSSVSRVHAEPGSPSSFDPVPEKLETPLNAEGYDTEWSVLTDHRVRPVISCLLIYVAFAGALSLGISLRETPRTSRLRKCEAELEASKNASTCPMWSRRAPVLPGGRRSSGEMITSHTPTGVAHLKSPTHKDDNGVESSEVRLSGSSKVLRFLLAPVLLPLALCIWVVAASPLFLSHHILNRVLAATLALCCRAPCCSRVCPARLFHIALNVALCGPATVLAWPLHATWGYCVWSSKGTAPACVLFIEGRSSDMAVSDASEASSEDKVPVDELF